MDDFEKNFPGFDWKNTPAYKHPGGKDCPCPKHEYIREQINVAKTMSENNKEVIPSMPFKYRLMTKVAVRLGAISIQKLTYMQSDQCFYCKFGSGGFDKKAELPPI
jgi:hypothetical protein